MSQRPQQLTVCVSAAQHRTYLIEFFKAAFGDLGVDGEVVALEYRPGSATFQVADRGVRMPAYNAPEYASTLTEWVATNRPAALFSMNDYEQWILSSGLAAELRTLGCAVGGATEHGDLLVDKWATAKLLDEVGVLNPTTVLASAPGWQDELPDADRYVVKHRSGAGSSGLHIVDRTELADAIAAACNDALTSDGHLLPAEEAASGVVIQPCIEGVDHCLSVSFPLTYASPKPLGVMATRKISSRGGDIAEGITVDAEVFNPIAEAVGQTFWPRGPMDLDVRVDNDGRHWLIDINPRFGGTYPFNHLAGARLPHAIVRELAGLPAQAEDFTCEADVTSLRVDSFRRITP